MLLNWSLEYDMIEVSAWTPSLSTEGEACVVLRMLYSCHRHLICKGPVNCLIERWVLCDPLGSIAPSLGVLSRSRCSQDY